MKYKLTSRMALSAVGNWCGHNPIKPRFFEIPQSHGERPDVIRIAYENAKNFYYQPYGWLQSLLLIHGSNRQERSEGRERDSAVIQVLLHYAELASMRVGVPCYKDGAFKSLSLKFIAERAGFRKVGDHTEKGIKRVWRALERLARAGYIVIHKRFEKYTDDEGLSKYKGLPAVKRLTVKLFTELGVSLHRLGIKRRDARKRLNKRIAIEKERMQELSKKTINLLGLVVTSSKRGLKKIALGKYKKYKDEMTRKAQAQTEFNRKKAATARLYTLMQQYPEMTAREIQQKFDVQLH